MYGWGTLLGIGQFALALYLGLGRGGEGSQLRQTMPIFVTGENVFGNRAGHGTAVILRKTVAACCR